MTHAEYADGLRQIADFLESHPEISLPEATLTCYSLASKKDAAITARALADGGRCNKVFDESVLRLKRVFGPIEVQYIGMRYNVCEQIKVGTRVVPERYVPPQPATLGQVVPEHEEAVYEWVCSPLLGKPDVEVPEEKALTAGAPLLEAEYVDIPF
jgi:hypothetical protein